MQCPKCGYRQSDANECRRCGIIIEKYLAAQERKRQLHDAEKIEEKGSKGLLYSVMLAGVLAVGVAYFMWGGVGPGSESAESTVADSQERPEQAVVRGQVGSVEKSLSPQKQRIRSNQLNPVVNDGLAAQLASVWTVSNPIEAARNATVSIVSPWGSGSGFFVDNTGTIITNRHVVQFDPVELNQLEQRAENLKRQLDNERKNLQLMKKQLASIRDRAVKDQVVENLTLREERYSQYYRVYEELQDKIETISRGNFLQDGKIVLIDGSEHQPTSLQVSREKDLATLSISVYNSPYIQHASPSEYPEQGKTVYTIGSPSGLSHTITSGIISGYRELSGKRFIQTDAPINPGNSGGPLINAEGKVLGVNTMIIKNTEGIGFAVPFSTVLTEFPGLGQSN